MPTLTKEERDKVLEVIKQHVSEYGNCRVGWAIGQVRKELTNSMHNIDKIANLIIQSPQYSKERPTEQKFKEDWNIHKNPSYNKQQLEMDLAQSTIEANRQTRINYERSLLVSIINIVLLILNIALVFWQALKS